MSSTNRMDRINELMRQEISLLLEEDAEQLGMISVVGVETSRDLAEAQVFIAPINPVDPAQLLTRVTAREREYRHNLTKRLHLKRIPRLEFKLDIHREALTRLETLLDQVAAGEK